MKKLIRVFLILLFIFGILPLAMYGYLFFSANTLSPDEAIKRLADEEAVLVDIREQNEFAERHIYGSVNIPYKKLLAEGIPQAYQGKDLFLICETGIAGFIIAGRLQPSGTGRIYNVKGGIQNWLSLREGYSRFLLLEYSNGSKEHFPFKDSTQAEQWAVVLTTFVVKPFYMIVSLILILVLAGKNQTDVRALRWGLIGFLAGEVACAVNFLFYNDDSYVVEYLHSYGMVMSIGFVVFAFLYGLDTRVLRYSNPDKKCSLLSICGSCYKYSDFQCRIRKLWLFGIPAMALMAIIPLMTELRAVSYQSEIFSAAYQYIHPAWNQAFEKKYASLVSILFFVIAFIVMKRSGKESFLYTKMLVSAGIGFLGFSYFRLLLLEPFADNLAWFISGEEILELAYIIGAAYTVWIFRHKLFKQSGNKLLWRMAGGN